MTKQLLIRQPNCWMVGGCYQEIIAEVCRKLKEYGAVKDEDGSGYFCSVWNVEEEPEDFVELVNEYTTNIVASCPEGCNTTFILFLIELKEPYLQLAPLKTVGIPCFTIEM